MAFFKILLRGMRDVYDQVAYFIVLSVIFCICCLPVILMYASVQFSFVAIPLLILSSVLIPPALIVLYSLADPRRILDRPERREVVSMFRQVFVRSWKIAICTFLPLTMIAWNIAFFRGSGHILEIFIPLWIVMWILLFVLTQYCFSLAGTHESGVRNAFRGGMFVMIKYPFRSVFLSLFILIIGYAAALSLLPMLLIGPGFFAAIVTRFVFDALDVYVLDPESPTDERAWERTRGINPDRSMVDRLFKREKK